ncbi:hypothetical protein JQ543_21305 [Bradyrhizobium diazoefficiens]|nr:hypothetical protein [Bradyrhizobium diazoefficiens]MBR0850296.1 hypothetical protein [Bradyrhizobium diazoefficiens]
MRVKEGFHAVERLGFARQETVVGAGAVVVLISLIAFRITQGVDFSDESYYAIFIDDWLKGSIATSASQSVHQTAALLVYPAALFYTKIVGSSDGLFLFLRVIFLAGAVASCCFWIAFLLRLGHRSLAWANGLAVLAFIPFGLPAPSYNTFAIQALVVALASFGCACIGVTERRDDRQRLWMMVSACAFAFGSVAYPPLTVLPLLVVLLCLRGPPLPRPLSYLALILAAVGLAWALVMLVLTPASLETISATSSAPMFGEAIRVKLGFVGRLLSTHPAFSILCLLSIGVGMLRLRAPVLAQIVLAPLILCLLAIQPTLHVHSHDVVTLVALSGVGLLAGLRSSAAPPERIVAALYAASLGAAFIISASATNAVYNFAVGAMPAAALSLLGPCPSRRAVASWISTLATVLALLSTSLFFYYGEWPRPVTPRERIAGGFFSGIAMGPNERTLLHLVEDRLVPILGDTQSLALFGRFPGLVLATNARLLMPIASPIEGVTSIGTPEKISAFYRTRQPDYVVLYRDPYFQFVNPIPDFDRGYVSISTFATPLGSLEILRRR